MEKIYLKTLLVAAGLASAVQLMAVDVPFAKEPVDGKTYILVSRSNPQRFWNRTGWDGAVYLQPFSNFNPANAITAHQQSDGTWTFTTDVTTEEKDEEGTVINTYTTTYYMSVPSGTDNLNINQYNPASWIVEESNKAGYYLLKAGEGQENEYTIGGYLHLNAGNEYLVISEPNFGGQWYPDYYGGVVRDENGDPILDNGFVIPLDPVSRYWAFVEVDDVANYNAKVPLYALLLDLEDNYLTIEGYAEGFRKAYDAALTYYNKDECTDEDMAAAKAIIDSKKALYDEILKAEELLGESSDAVLSTAIAAAKKAFDEQYAVEDMETAIQALKEAEKAFAMQGTDYTALGTNMSFEDLSAQGDQQSSSVANPPAGWNVFVKGKQVTTAAEVHSAGIANWHGVNDDAEGEAMDGEYAFGLWTSSVPEYEISQVITGLENGTYIISAGLMVGANGSGSRMTTQRIFGNLNSKYFANAGDYNLDLLDKSEVFDFQGLIEPVTDRELQPISVRAFVFDGTLTFGLRTNGLFTAAMREAPNNAGGDGWFKVDNFRITKVGYNENDALAVYNYFVNLFKDYSSYKMQKSISEQLKALTTSGIGAGSPQQDIINAIVSLRDIFDDVQQSIALYSELKETMEKAASALIEYEYSASVDDFSDLYMEAEDMYYKAESGDVEVKEMIAKLEAGIEELKASAITIGDITHLLKNPSFEDLSAQYNTVSDGAVPAPAGWTLLVNGEPAETVSGGWCAINHGDNINVQLEDGSIIDHQYTDGEHLWGIWNSNMPEVELSQTLKHMPPGTYTLTADVMIQFNWAGDNTTTQRIFGNNAVQMWGTEDKYEINLPEDAKNASQLTYAGYVCAQGLTGLANSDLLHPMKVVFAVGEDGIAKIGFRTNGINSEGKKFSEGGLNGQGWFKVDNFRLSYDSDDPSLGINTISQHGTTDTRFYSLDGRLLNAPQHGINIMRVTDKNGKVKTYKILVK